jgi:hypothetical protein
LPVAAERTITTNAAKLVQISLAMLNIQQNQVGKSNYLQ